jgi:TetR/AcrR family transcriptional regulator, regulator of cefoperazone and chloramphenicol sensitivity
MHASAPIAETQHALLQAAGEVFAEHGYRDTTVREICQRAGANVAAVNYHFGDKEHLYLEVLRHSQTQAMQKYPPDMGTKPNAPAEQRLRAYIRSFLFRILEVGPTAWHGKLMVMEMINPTRALDTLVEERFRSMTDQLLKIVRDLLGPGAPPERVQFCAGSVVSQCLFYHHCRSIILRLYPGLRFDPPTIERLADHITQFSLAALKNFARRAPPRR